jgi:hypothetical protein
VTLSVGSESSGGETATYQWFFNGEEIPGATGATFTIGNVTPAHAGSYTVAITNVVGTVVSIATELTLQTGGGSGGDWRVLSGRASCGVAGMERWRAAVVKSNTNCIAMERRRPRRCEAGSASRASMGMTAGAIACGGEMPPRLPVAGTLRRGS